MEKVGIKNKRIESNGHTGRYGLGGGLKIKKWLKNKEEWLNEEFNKVS